MFRNQVDLKTLWVYLQVALSFALLGAQAPPTVERSLKTRGIDNSLAALRQALEDPRSEVRGMAATRLASKNDTSSIPLIRAALSKAPSPVEKVNLAQALLTLKDPQGVVAMKSECADLNVGEDLRLTAAVELRDSGRNDCLVDVISVLAATSDHNSRFVAMQIVRETANEVPSNVRDQLQHGLQSSLQDELETNRKTASELLALFKMTSAAPALRDAMERERDRDTRMRMDADLDKLNRMNK